MLFSGGMKVINHSSAFHWISKGLGVITGSVAASLGLRELPRD